MYSTEHINYLKELKKRNVFIILFRVLVFVLFIVLWQLFSDLGFINTFIFSSPKRIIETIVNIDNLFKHISITIYETLLSFLLGTIIGIFISTILWWNKTFYKIIEPYLTIINSLPKVALGPIIIIWFGSGIKSIIIMALLISVIVTIMNISNSFNSVDENKIILFKSFKATKKQLFLKLILPSSKNEIISTLKINISMTLIGVIMGEFLVSKQGIGYLIMYGSQTFNLNLVMTGIFILSIVASLMYYLVFLIEKKLTQRS